MSAAAGRNRWENVSSFDPIPESTTNAIKRGINHLSRQHRSHGLAKCLQLARPTVGRGTSFDTNQAWRLEERQHLATLQLAPDDHPAVGIFGLISGPQSESLSPRSALRALPRPKMTTKYSPPGIKPQMAESPAYGAILRHLEPIGPIGRI
jgi:hypothetical protein